MSKEFSSDSEFYGNFSELVDSFNKNGWKLSGTPGRSGRKVSCLFIKDGYAVYGLYGCEEDVREEVL